MGDEPGLICLRIWVGGLRRDVTADEVRRKFDQFGEVTDVRVRSSDRDTFAFVQYTDQQSVDAVLQKTDWSTTLGDRVRVAMATVDGKKKRPEGNVAERRRGDSRDPRDDPRAVHRCDTWERRERGGQRDSRQAGRRRRRDRSRSWENTYSDGRRLDNRRGDRLRGERRGDRDGYQSDSREVERSRRRPASDYSFSPQPRGHRHGRSGYGERSKYRRDRAGHADRRSRSQRRSPRCSCSPRGRRSLQSPRSPCSAREACEAAGVVRYAGKVPVGRHKVTVENLPDDMSWLELKDLARDFGSSLTFARTYQHGSHYYGMLEYKDRTDAENAIREFDNRRVQGSQVRLRAYWGGGPSG